MGIMMFQISGFYIKWRLRAGQYLVQIQKAPEEQIWSCGFWGGGVYRLGFFWVQSLGVQKAHKHKHFSGDIPTWSYLIGLQYKGVYMGYPYPNFCLCAFLGSYQSLGALG